MFRPIENTPRDYAWGRRDAITALLGRPPTGGAEAELWFGAHSGSPARLVGEPRTLLDVMPELPFLLKVLAAGAPLSLQAHPDAERARDGFARENAAGVASDAVRRNYRDPFSKPEILVAVSERFEALCGFRPAAEARTDILRIASRIDAERRVAHLVERLVDDAHVGDVLIWLLEGGPEAAGVVGTLEEALRTHPGDFAHWARIATEYPGDPGIAGALLLHHVVLSPGEALYLPAGNIHAYLDGIGIELMAPSDNVLRGGLTSKHVDVPELARVLDRSAGPVPRLLPIPMAGGGLLYSPADPHVGFSLVAVDSHASIALEGPAIVLCADGAFSIRGAVSSLEVGRGDALLATAEEGMLEIAGSGSLYLAR